MKKYKHFISLGYFCSTAMELERIGLRGSSYPFDWCISNYEGVITAIKNQFEGFLSYDYLLQDEKKHNHYFNKKYKIWFFHDFDSYHSLNEQLPKVKEKYSRRIDRFYENIKEPTLFVRYISDKRLNDGKIEEIEYIEKNNQKIVALLKKFNSKNDIVYIANGGVTSEKIKIFNVEKDTNDLVARRPLDKNKELNDLFMSFEYELRQRNIDRFKYKQRMKKNIIVRIYKKIYICIQRKIIPEYIHTKRIKSI